jgi:amphi-Trp domain-containing protein
MKFEKKETLSRKDAVDRLKKIAAALASDEVEIKLGNDTLEFDVAPRMAFEFELKIDGDETELELELKWIAPAKGEAPTEAVVAKPAAPKSVVRKPAKRKPVAQKPAKRRAAAT